jgi:hypothetical protein
MRHEWSIFLRQAFLLKAFPKGRVSAYAIPRIIARQSLSRERHLCAIMESVWPKVLAQADTTGGDRSQMKRSTDRILTTHTGSLPRNAKVIELLLAEQRNRGARKAELNAAVGAAIAHVVQKQIESGIDIINDGEQGRTDYTVHVLDRLTGFAGESTPPLAIRNFRTCAVA